MNSKYSNRLPSNRKFGFFLSLLFFVVSIYILAFYKLIIPFLFLMFLSLICAIIAQSNPDSLKDLNEKWSKIGEILGRFVSPFVLGVIFFFVITPVAVVSRFFGRDELRMNLDDSSTWWIDVQPKKNDIQAFKQQF